ncbi:hypothetical protein HanXRQr2_Chr16g0738471 [Helianthus annuus]|uniref:Uncharacterized protein n=1 Tax=Helianthus annuus TaxID=4232 RepID=A0A251UVP0_HELAN|nr:hypothetical protein HanXRQr2_Chr16g0738471 [Helianthus annuus]
MLNLARKTKQSRKVANEDWLSGWRSDRMTIRSNDHPIGWPFDRIVIRSMPSHRLILSTL